MLLKVGLVAVLLVMLVRFRANAERLVVPDHLRGPAAILQHTCQQETGLTDEVVTQLIADRKLPESRAFKCHLHCLLAKVGMYDDHRNIDFDLIWHIVPDDHKPKYRVVMDKCKTIHGEDQCETAFLTLQCFTVTDPDVDLSEWFTKEL